jgi:hypothetical protein
VIGVHSGSRCTLLISAQFLFVCELCLSGDGSPRAPGGGSPRARRAAENGVELGLGINFVICTLTYTFMTYDEWDL